MVFVFLLDDPKAEVKCMWGLIDKLTTLAQFFDIKVMGEHFSGMDFASEMYDLGIWQ